MNIVMWILHTVALTLNLSASNMECLRASHEYISEITEIDRTRSVTKHQCSKIPKITETILSQCGLKDDEKLRIMIEMNSFKKNCKKAKSLI